MSKSPCTGTLLMKVRLPPPPARRGNASEVAVPRRLCARGKVPVSPEQIRRLAQKARVVGGWLMLPLALFCTVGAFIAVNELANGEALLLLALAGWSGFEFSRFWDSR